MPWKALQQKFFQRRGAKPDRVGVLLFDGWRWRGRLFEKSLSIGEEFTSEFGSAKELPDPLLVRMAAAGMTRLRLLIPTDVFLVAMERMEGLRPEEIQTALSWEVSGASGDKAGGVRVAAVKAVEFGLAEAEGKILATSFRMEELKAFEKTAERHQVRLEGIGSLPLAVLGIGTARAGQDEAFFFVGRERTFACLPAFERAALRVRNVPQGWPPARESVAEWGANFARRLPPMAGRRAVFLIGDVLGEMPFPGTETFLPGLTSRVEPFDRFAVSVLESAATAPIGSLEHPSALIGPPPRETDATRPVLLATLATLGFLLLLFLGIRLYLGKQLDALTDQVAQAQTVLNNRRAQDAGQRESQLKNQGQQYLQILFSEKGNIQSPLVELLETLGRGLPSGCRLVSIREDDNRLVLEGTTRLQGDLMRVSELLEKRFAATPYRVSPRDAKNVSGKEGLAFSFALEPR